MDGELERELSAPDTKAWTHRKSCADTAQHGTQQWVGSRAMETPKDLNKVREGTFSLVITD